MDLPQPTHPLHATAATAITRAQSSVIIHGRMVNASHRLPAWLFDLARGLPARKDHLGAALDVQVTATLSPRRLRAPSTFLVELFQSFRWRKARQYPLSYSSSPRFSSTPTHWPPAIGPAPAALPALRSAPSRRRSLSTAAARTCPRRRRFRALSLPDVGTTLEGGLAS